MGKISWKPEYDLKIEKIDNQHRKIIDLILELLGAAEKNTGASTIHQVLGEMKKYVSEHLEFEEMILRLVQYPDYLSHQNLHDQFRKKVLEFEYSLQTGNLVMASQLAGFLGDWFTNHINVEDRKYAAFMAQKGIQV